MMQLHQDYKLFVEKDTEIVAVGPENPAEFKKFWDEHEFEFTGIADPEQKILKLFDQKIRILKLGRMPAQILIDKSGTLRYMHYGNSMKDIPENSEILDIIDKIERA